MAKNFGFTTPTRAEIRAVERAKQKSAKALARSGSKTKLKSRKLNTPSVPELQRQAALGSDSAARQLVKMNQPQFAGGRKPSEIGLSIGKDGKIANKHEGKKSAGLRRSTEKEPASEGGKSIVNAPGRRISGREQRRQDQAAMKEDGVVLDKRKSPRAQAKELLRTPTSGGAKSSKGSSGKTPGGGNWRTQPRNPTNGRFIKRG